MNEPTPSAQNSHPSRRHSRKLRLAFAAFGILLAALLFLMALSARSERQGVRIRLDHVSTDRDQNVFLWFTLNNTESRAVILRGLDIDVRMNEQWLTMCREAEPSTFLAAGQSTNLVVIGSRYAKAYRGELIWDYDITRFQRFRFRVQGAVRELFRKPNAWASVSRVLHWHTNRLEECYP